MSFDCQRSPTNLTHTSAQQKLKAKNAAKVYRFGSPKLRDMLREKCRLRVREARQFCFLQQRQLKGTFAENLAFTEILKEELAELETDLNLQEQIYQELFDEFNEWFIEQLEAEEAYIVDVADHNNVICPICQKAALNYNMEAKIYKCSCDVSFYYTGTQEELQKDLQTKINEHEQKCTHKLTFFISPNEINDGQRELLYVLCESCDYFCSF